MKTTTQFQDILIQVGTIIFSILMAFSIDAWWADRKQQIEEIEQLESIKSELVLGIEVKLHSRYLDTIAHGG